MKKIELLAPAGDKEKLLTALDFGADAVYLGGSEFGLRVASKNFSGEDLKNAVKICHERGKKIYVTVNIQAHNRHFEGMEDYLKFLESIGVDAAIISDDGIFRIARRVAPGLAVHISTQASITNYETILFWHEQGVRRAVLARELSLEEIKEIRRHIPEDMELEAFVHGAMCISYSGRCLLSNYMTGRDANLGDCAHSCRWKYHLVEETRPGEYFPIEDREEGSFIMNSKDLCTISHLDELMNSGITSFKIEGRVKTAYYVATVTRAYRLGMDAVEKGQYSKTYADFLLQEIKKASYREFTTGFYFKRPDEHDQLYSDVSYIRNYDFVGRVLEIVEEKMKVEQRNRMLLGDEIEAFGPREKIEKFVIQKMWDEEGNSIESAPHPKQILWMPYIQGICQGDFLRKKAE